jgi:hypothetical protein
MALNGPKPPNALMPPNGLPPKGLIPKKAFADCTGNKTAHASALALMSDLTDFLISYLCNTTVIA